MDTKRLLELSRALPEKPSASADRSFRASLKRLRSLTAEERMLRALELGERRRAFLRGPPDAPRT